MESKACLFKLGRIEVLLVATNSLLVTEISLIQSTVDSKTPPSIPRAPIVF